MQFVLSSNVLVHLSVVANVGVYSLCPLARAYTAACMHVFVGNPYLCTRIGGGVTIPFMPRPLYVKFMLSLACAKLQIIRGEPERAPNLYYSKFAVPMYVCMYLCMYHCAIHVLYWDKLA